jgi:hypothetical protein
VGLCGIDDVSEATSGSSAISSDRSWFMDMPALVAPVALIGWIVTSVICGGCWFCYVFYASTVPLAAVVQSESTVVHGIPLPAQQTPPTAAVVHQPTIDMTSTPPYNSSTRRNEFQDRGIAKSTRPVDAAATEPNRLHAAMKTGPVHASIEFYKPTHQLIPHLIDMRLPSFDNRHSKLFAGQTSSLGHSAA